MLTSLGFFGLYSSPVSAHSWVHCTDYRGDVGTYEKDKCFGHPRPKTGDLLPDHVTFGQDIGFDTQTGVCQSAVLGTPVIYQRGQIVRLAWPSKNHVAAACTNPFIPDTSLNLYVAEEAAEPSLSDFELVPNFAEPNKFQNCPRFCENMDKSLCTGTFVVPSNLADGRYTFQWRWVFNEGTEPYVTCWEAEIQGESTDGGPLATTAQPQTTPGSTSNTPGTTTPPAEPCGNGEWAQCDGQSFGGQRCCGAGLSCFEQSIYYSQCLRSCPGEGWNCHTQATTTEAPPATTTTEAPPATTTTEAAPATTTTEAAPATTTTEAPPATTTTEAPPATTTTSSPTWEGFAGTTRYWDCCKPSCSWPSNVGPLAAGYSSVKSCTIDGSEGDPNAINVCSGGGDAAQDIVYSCPDNAPFTKDGVLYGFAAAGGPLSGCCSCYELEFTDSCTGSCAYQGQLEGRRMIVQVTNTGADLGTAHFDLQIPGGGFGIFNGCSAGEQGTNGPPQFMELTEAWGQRFGGVTSQDMCEGLPSEMQSGCNWRFEDFLNADNPAVKYRAVKCPAVLTDISGCRLADEPSTEPDATSSPPVSTDSPPVSTDSPPATTTPATPPATTQQTCAGEWGQCGGGSSFTGPTCCESGLTCFKQHAYYSQCTKSCPTGWECDMSTTTESPPATTTTEAPHATTTTEAPPATTTTEAAPATTTTFPPTTTTADNCVCTCDAPQ